MRSSLLAQQDKLRTFVVVLETGEEAMASLLEFAKQQDLGGSHFTAIGAFSRAVVGYFDFQTKKYQRHPVDEQVEVLSIIGDVAIEDGKPKLHAHAVLGRSDASTRGGHLLEGYVRPTLEVMLTELPRHLQRRFDPAAGITVIDPSFAAR